MHFLSPRITYVDPPPPSPGYWDSFNATAPFVIITDKSDTANLTGKILLYQQKALETMEDTITFFRDTGIVAFFTVYRQQSNFPGIGNWVRSGQKVPDHNYPIYEVSLPQLKQIKAIYDNQSVLMMTVMTDPNPWLLVETSVLPALGVVTLTFSGIVAIMAVYKLTVLVLVYGFQLSVSQVVLWLTLIGSVLRAVFGGVDPWAAYGGTFLFEQVFVSIHYPFVVASCLLLSLYWHELIKKTGGKINLFLDKLKWPFLIVSVVMFCFELATGILRGLDDSYSVRTESHHSYLFAPLPCSLCTSFLHTSDEKIGADLHCLFCLLFRLSR